MYVKGKDNVVADALSRIILTSNELKDMNNKSVMVTTRAQSKIMEEQKRMESHVTDIPNIDTNKRPDQPRVVEILWIPDNAVEMILTKREEIQKLRNKGLISWENECFSFEKSKNIIHINLDFKLHFTRVKFVTKLSEYCKKINVKQICIIKNDENELFIKRIIQEIKNIKEWSGPHVCVLRGIKRIDNDDDKNFIINDYHVLPTSGHAGIRRMISNIKRKLYWPSIENDVRKFVRQCDACQRNKHSRHTVEPLVITSTSTSAFQKIYLDLVGPLDQDEESYKYILDCTM